MQGISCAKQVCGKEVEGEKKEKAEKNLSVTAEKCIFAAETNRRRLMLGNDVKEMIPKIQQYLASQPVEKAWFFGSCSRGEETPKSDVDLMVRYKDSDSLSLFDIAGIMVSLKKIIRKPVDLVEEGCLLPFAQKSANRDKILIYERNG